jgi:phasin
MPAAQLEYHFFHHKDSPMPEHKSPDLPSSKRNKKGIVQSDAEARSARKTPSKTPPPKEVLPPRQMPPEEVLPPRQIEEPSKGVELAARETPFTSPTAKIAMDPKMTMQVPDAVRDLAAKSINQAEKAFDMFFDAAKKMTSIQSPGTEISRQALSFTEQNVKAAFDHARKLVQATDFQQAMQIQSEFLKSQFTNAAQHMQQITGAVISSAKDASKDKFQGLPSTTIQ